ncbi:Uncharacterized protein TCM_007952 [Theobroma cacao]|uniref:Uncharacterized protein n=1 Tax=Theobroma cacao TaxID=3641 RepID=A0A061E4P6_THECC|nr:Uncharacterized protein TCM_007952 [Theobroma cacao]
MQKSLKVVFKALRVSGDVNAAKRISGEALKSSDENNPMVHKKPGERAVNRENISFPSHAGSGIADLEIHPSTHRRRKSDSEVSYVPVTNNSSNDEDIEVKDRTDDFDFIACSYLSMTNSLIWNVRGITERKGIRTAAPANEDYIIRDKRIMDG